MSGFYKFKREIVFYALIIAPLILVGLMWDKIPASIPTHFNFAGEPDQWSDKYLGAFIGPGVGVILYLLMLVVPRIDPKRKNFLLFDGAYYSIRLAIQVFISAISILSVLKAVYMEINIGYYVINLILLLFIVLGNFFGKLRFNYTVGIRVPWTLNSEQVWNLTHRLAGKIWVFGSLTTILIGFFVDLKTLGITFIINTVIITLIPIIYSYKMDKKINKNEE